MPGTRLTTGWRLRARLKSRPASTWLRVFRVVFVLPFSFALIACSVSAYRIYALNRSIAQHPVPAMPALVRAQSILIFSPHPDDECLGTAGLMQAAKKAGTPVHVVYMTSGDGFRFGISRYYHKLNVGPADFKRYGEMRMGESRSALKSLGLAPSDITFLGYPDRGLMAMWREHWNTGNPFLSQYSRTREGVYREALHPGAPFAAQSVLSDVVEMLQANRPTDVYVTHPNDDHDDHSAASAFVALAVEKLKASGEPWTRRIQLHYYLVHRGDWPVPQGVHPNEPLSPPAQMMACGTTWRELPLTQDEEQGKLRALNCYKSQEEMMGRFLKSFVRRTEIFGDLAGAESVMATETLGPARLVSGADHWPEFKTVAIDPTSDNVVISLQKGADIRQLSAYHDSKYLYVRMDTNGSLLPEVHYVLHIRAADFAGAATDKEVAVTINPRAMVDSRPIKDTKGIVTEWHADHVLAQVPLSLISAPNDGLVFIEGVTHFSNVPFDRTGPRPIRIHIDPQAPQSAPLT